MIEIVALVMLTRLQSQIVGRRGLATLWGFLGPAMMIAGEVLGGTLGVAFGLGRLEAYAIAITHGFVGVVVSFAIIEFIPAPRQ